MPEPMIQVFGLDEVIQRMEAYPTELHQGMDTTMEASLLVLQENVPAYPQASETSTYRRTGTLGRTLGSAIGGGKSGTPEIFEVRSMGSAVEGRFGTNLDYAPHVIGDETQAWMHYRWFTMKTIADRATAKITRLWVILGEQMVAFMERGKR